MPEQLSGHLIDFLNYRTCGAFYTYICTDAQHSRRVSCHPLFYLVHLFLFNDQFVIFSLLFLLSFFSSVLCFSFLLFVSDNDVFLVQTNIFHTRDGKGGRKLTRSIQENRKQIKI